MKLSHEEVAVLVRTIAPSVWYYYDAVQNDRNSRNVHHYEVLSKLQARLEEYHDTTMQLESEAEQD
jgi:hypothetical protein